MLDLVKRTNDYVIYLNDQPLLTPEGRVLAHPRSRLLKHILTDMLLAAEGERVLSFDLLSFEYDHLRDGEDPVKFRLDELLQTDPFVRIKTGTSTPRKGAGNPLTEQQINLSFWIFSELLSIVNAFFEEQVKIRFLAEPTDKPFAVVIRSAYRDLTDPQKSAVNLLVNEHAPGIVLPLLLVLNRISPAEYTKGLISLAEGDQCEKTSNRIIAEASSIRDYLLTVQSEEWIEEQVEEFIRKGESGSLEFKSTLRWDIYAKKPNPAIERASLKSIAAFLNTAGGILVIGIRDDGSTEGIETDTLQTDDRWMLHLWNLILGSMGKEVSEYIRTRLIKRENRTICLVECRATPRPVFLRQKGFPEEFFIRIGPASTPLTVSEAITYLATHFQSTQTVTSPTDHPTDH